MPLISVITPSYNVEQFLRRTIESVQAQTLDDWEMIIVDDCSTDASYQIAVSAAKQDGRITALRLDKNSGSSVARNTALRKAKGQYITFIDGDDTIMPEKFEKQIAFMKHHDYAITYTNYRRMTPDEKTIGILQRNPKTIDYKYLLTHTAMGTLTPVYDRHMVGEHFFDETLKARMDYTFWLDVLSKGFTAHRLDLDLARYRRGHHSLSSNVIKGSKIVWRIYHKRQNLGLFRALWCFGNYVAHALFKRRAF